MKDKYTHEIALYAELSKRFNIVNTPLSDFSSLSQNLAVKIFAKDESANLTGSVKVRAALFNIAQSIIRHKEKKQLHFLDASSGNYAKSLAFLANKLGHDCTIFIPESFYMDLNKFMITNNLKSKIFFKGIKNSDEARENASKFAKAHPEFEYLDQYSNDGTWLCHYYFTAKEIIQQLKEKSLSPTHFISGIGSGGTLIGVGKALKEHYHVKIIGIQSRVPHTIRGIRNLDENIPLVYLNHKEIVDKLEGIGIKEVIEFKEGHKLDYGISACANLLKASELSSKISEGVIITIIPDRGS